MKEIELVHIYPVKSAHRKTKQMIKDGYLVKLDKPFTTLEDKPARFVLYITPDGKKQINIIKRILIHIQNFLIYR